MRPTHRNNKWMLGLICASLWIATLVHALAITWLLNIPDWARLSLALPPCAFALLLLFHPVHFFRRMTSVCVTSALLSGIAHILPSELTFECAYLAIQLRSVLKIAADPTTSVCATALALAFGTFHFLQRRSHTTTDSTTPRLWPPLLSFSLSLAIVGYLVSYRSHDYAKCRTAFKHSGRDVLVTWLDRETLVTEFSPGQIPSPESRRYFTEYSTSQGLMLSNVTLSSSDPDNNWSDWNANRPLTFLSLDRCYPAHEVTDLASGLEALTYLSLADIHLDTPDMVPAASIIHINLSGWQTGRHWRLLANCRNLRSLNASKSNINTAELTHIMDACALTALDISYTTLAATPHDIQLWQGLGRCETLSTLGLDGKRIESQAFTSIQQLNQLHHLHLHMCQPITNSDVLDAIDSGAWPNLTDVWLPLKPAERDHSHTKRINTTRNLTLRIH